MVSVVTNVFFTIDSHVSVIILLRQNYPADLTILHVLPADIIFLPIERNLIWIAVLHRRHT